VEVNKAWNFLWAAARWSIWAEYRRPVNRNKNGIFLAQNGILSKRFLIPYPVFHVPFPFVSIFIPHIRKRSVQNREREPDGTGQDFLVLFSGLITSEIVGHLGAALSCDEWLLPGPRSPTPEWMKIVVIH
jgi:hypothetical protein